MKRKTEDALLQLSVNSHDADAAKQEWKLFGAIECSGTKANPKWICEACGHTGLKYRANIANIENGIVIKIGQECALYFGVLEEGFDFAKYWKRQLVDEAIDELMLKNNATLALLGGQWLSKTAHDKSLRDLELGQKFTPNQILYLVQRFTEESIPYDVEAMSFWARSTIPQIKSGKCETLKMSDSEFSQIQHIYSKEMVAARAEKLGILENIKKAKAEEEANRRREREKRENERIAKEKQDAEEREQWANENKRKAEEEEAEAKRKAEEEAAKKISEDAKKISEMRKRYSELKTKAVFRATEFTPEDAAEFDKLSQILKAKK